MKNSTALMYLGALAITFIGMIVHINLMIETSDIIHLVCFSLWFIICSGLVLIFKHKLRHNED